MVLPFHKDLGLSDTLLALAVLQTLLLDILQVHMDSQLASVDQEPYLLPPYKERQEYMQDSLQAFAA
jgi:hypothetical protein